ncbi:MAG: NfeD family protein [Enhydrobacter sp.]|nr:MAG: NfeD family protein [Enhydrobacter sp.]
MFKIVFWYWWALAAVLLVAEMTLPGVVFLFLAIGAAAAGVVLVVVPETSIEWQLAVFAVFAAASALALRPIFRRLQQARAGDATLNSRGQSLVGRTIVLDEPILGGRGRVKLGDGSWSVTGPDMVAGARVRVAAVNGTELRVEPTP